MTKARKALLTIAVIVLLFVPRVQSFVPVPLGSILLVAAFTYGISLIFSIEIPALRRFAISYLLLTGLTYLVVGILGLSPGWGLIETSAWYSLITPYPLISFVDQWAHHFPYTISRAPYEVIALPEHRVFSGVVIAVSSLAVVAAFAMSRQKKLAYKTWLFLLVIVAVELSGYLIVGFVSWGFRQTGFAVCLAASYFVAYALARKDVVVR